MYRRIGFLYNFTEKIGNLAIIAVYKLYIPVADWLEWGYNNINLLCIY